MFDVIHRRSQIRQHSDLTFHALVVRQEVFNQREFHHAVGNAAHQHNVNQHWQLVVHRGKLVLIVVEQEDTAFHAGVHQLDLSHDFSRVAEGRDPVQLLKGVFVGNRVLVQN